MNEKEAIDLAVKFVEESFTEAQINLKTIKAYDQTKFKIELEGELDYDSA